MNHRSTRVFIAGGGPAGLAAAALLAKEGVACVLVSPGAADDPRTVALMQPAICLLGFIGLWPAELAGIAAPLRKLRITDDTGALMAAPELIFEAQELGLDAFGWNVPLQALLTLLAKRATELGATLLEGAVVAATKHGDEIEIKLSTGETYRAQVAIAADGIHSVMRVSSGIAVDTWTYDQMAIATSFSHSVQHQATSNEWHRPGGPFTTVPLPGGRSSLVWMERPEEAAHIMQLSDRDLAAEVQLATHGELGLVTDMGPRKAFAMKGQTARRFAGSRVLLVGESAHVVPPIGAQGLNMSLGDAALAAELILASADAGCDAVLAKYDAMRRPEVAMRQRLVDLMNRSLLLGYLPLESGRILSLAALKYVGPLRKFVMQQGLAQAANLPHAMRHSG